MKKYNITLFGVKETSDILAEYLFQQGIQIDLIVSIDPTLTQHLDIADFMDLKPTADSIGADYHCVSNYSLKHNTIDFFKQHTFKLGIVYGWQRLIPECVIQQFQDGLFGFHASPEQLPKGRGRSPMNWGIIQGKKILYNHCFKYITEADAGDIYSITPFEITPHDTIRTLLYKSLLIAEQKSLQLIQDIKAGPLCLTPQHGESYFFPKRTPEEGCLDFSTQSTQALVDLIRAVTHPFSGAFCYTTHGMKITIWEAWNFDGQIDFSSYQPGEVISTLYNMPVIRTLDGSIIIKQYEGITLEPHMTLQVKRKMA
jgi:methionyl-tRNA formyltransferase